MIEDLYSTSLLRNGMALAREIDNILGQVTDGNNMSKWDRSLKNIYTGIWRLEEETSKGRVNCQAGKRGKWMRKWQRVQSSVPVSEVFPVEWTHSTPRDSSCSQRRGLGRDKRHESMNVENDLWPIQYQYIHRHQPLFKHNDDKIKN